MYKDSVLQYILNEEGRTRAFADSNHLTKYVYDYFVKDHLGNVRSTVTAQPMNGIYLAEHELAAANIEQLIFDNIPNVRDGRPGSTDPEDHMAAPLNAAAPERTVGTSILLKTMPGDRFSLSVDAYYEGTMNGESQATGDDVVSSLLTALTGGINYEGVPVSELPANVKTAQDILQNTSLGGLIDQLQNSDNPDAPKAHLNYLFFNDKFELLGGSSGSVQVPMGLQGWGTITPGSSNNNSSTVTGTEVSSDQGGYLLVYVDNQTIGKDVWFDHLMIGHYTGGVMEENHYYPYGLTVQTDVAAGAGEQPYKYQGIEQEQHFGLETFETDNRGLDPQTGRWRQIDPFADVFSSQSPYVSMDDNPANNTDPDGTFSRFGAWWRNIAWGGDGISKSKKTGEWGVEYNYIAPNGTQQSALVSNGAKPVTQDEARAQLLERYNNIQQGIEMGSVKTNESGAYIRTVDGQPLDAPMSGQTRAQVLVNLLEPGSYSMSPVKILTKMKSKTFPELRKIARQNAPLFRKLLGTNEKVGKAILDNIKDVKIPEGLSKKEIESISRINK